MDILKALAAKLDPITSRFMRLQLDLGTAIRRGMEEAGIKTQEELAERINMKPSQLNSIINGRTNVTIYSLARIEAGLGQQIVFVKHMLHKDLPVALSSQALISFSASIACRKEDQDSLLGKLNLEEASNSTCFTVGMLLGAAATSPAPRMSITK